MKKESLRTIGTKYTTNQSGRKANDCDNASFCAVRDTNDSQTSQWRATSAAFCKNNMEELLRFALLEGTMHESIDEQENKNTRAKTDRDVSLLKKRFSKEGRALRSY